MSELKVYLVLLLCLALALLASLAAAEPLDPTRPPPDVAAGRTTPPDAAAARVQTAWRLDSTLVSDFRKVAVINGQRVTEGMRLGGARVARISRHEVLLIADGREIYLKEARPADVKQKKGT